MWLRAHEQERLGCDPPSNTWWAAPVEAAWSRVGRHRRPPAVKRRSVKGMKMPVAQLGCAIEHPPLDLPIHVIQLPISSSILASITAHISFSVISSVVMFSCILVWRRRFTDRSSSGYQMLRTYRLFFFLSSFFEKFS